MRSKRSGAARPRTAGLGLNVGSIFDVLEKLSAILPHVIKGGRGILSSKATHSAAASAGLGSIEKEVSFQTPASFATIRNNTTSMSPEQRVDHPEKGVSGIRRVFTQPFNGINLELTSATPPVAYFWDASVIPSAHWIDVNTIPINPLILGGPIAAFASLYDRYVIRKFRLRFTTTQTTTFLGTTALCIEKDLGNLTATDFSSARQVVPNVVFPYRVPCAEIFYDYDGPELYYVNSNALSTPATLLPAEARQDIQFVVKGYDANDSAGFPTPGTQCGYCDLEIEIDFFDPIPPSHLGGHTAEERVALQTVRDHYRQERETTNRSTVLQAVAEEKEFATRLTSYLNTMPKARHLGERHYESAASAGPVEPKNSKCEYEEDFCMASVPLTRESTLSQSRTPSSGLTLYRR
jgi:hypothetical protein